MNNFELVMEVCGLDEAGYKLAGNQRDLTIIQKLFIAKAWPIFNNEMQRQYDTEKEPSKPNPEWTKRQEEKREQR